MKFPSSREQMEHEMKTDISQIETRVTIRDPAGVVVQETVETTSIDGERWKKMIRVYDGSGELIDEGTEEGGA